MKTPNQHHLPQLRGMLRQIKPGLPPDLPATDHLRDDWELDSLDLVEYAARIEYQFRVIIPDEDLEQFYSLENIAAYLVRRSASADS